MDTWHSFWTMPNGREKAAAVGSQREEEEAFNGITPIVRAREEDIMHYDSPSFCA